LVNASRYERNEARKDTRAGYYNRKLLTKAGEVNLKMPKLGHLPFEIAIVERYKRRAMKLAKAAEKVETSIEDTLIYMDLAGAPTLFSANLAAYLVSNWSQGMMSASFIQRLSESNSPPNGK
jgi:transposase-like protein